MANPNVIKEAEKHVVYGRIVCPETCKCGRREEQAIRDRDAMHIYRAVEQTEKYGEG
jgi:hypothetical protein